MRYLWIVLIPALAACGDKGLTGDVRYNFLNGAVAGCKAEISRTGKFNNADAIREFCSCQSIGAADSLTNQQVSDAEATGSTEALRAIKDAVVSAGKDCIKHLTP